MRNRSRLAALSLVALRRSGGGIEPPRGSPAAQGAALVRLALWSGSREALPPPRPLRTGHAGFLASGSSIGATCLGRTRSPPWPWGQPGRYYGRAGSRDELRWRLEHQRKALRPRRPFCITAYAGWLTPHARRHPREVSPLSRGVVSPLGSTPCPAPYRPAFACSLILNPQPHRLTSRLAFPDGRATGLPRSTGVTRRVRSCLQAGGASSAAGEQ
jgi:hypothetical protein